MPALLLQRSWDFQFVKRFDVEHFAMKHGSGVGGAGLIPEAGLWKLYSFSPPHLACHLCATRLSGTGN